MKRILVALALLCLVGWQTGETGNEQEHFLPYTRQIEFVFNAANVGLTAPDSVTIGTRRCLQFNQTNTAETANTLIEVPYDWDGATDMTLELFVYAEDGAVPAINDVIQFTATYSVTAEGEAYDKTTTAIAVSYTEASDPGVAKGRVKLTGTIDFDNANNPLAAGGHVGIDFDLHEANTTYTGNPYLCDGDVNYSSNKLPHN